MDGEPQQEPAVVLPAVEIEGNADALAVVRGDVPVSGGFGVGQDAVNGLLAGGAEVLRRDGQADLGGFDRFLQVRDQGAQALAFLLEFHGLDDQHGHQIHAVIQEVVLLQGRVAAGLDGERAGRAFLVQADRLVDDVAVAALEAVVLAAPGADEPGQAGGGHRVGDDGLAGPVLQQDRAHQGDQAVTVDLAPVGVHHGGPVAVRVKDHAQVGAGLFDRGGDGIHGDGVLGVRAVIREHAVGLQELAALGASAEALHQIGVKAARAVAGVHHHVQALQGLFGVGLQAAADARRQLLHIDGQEGPFDDRAAEREGFGLHGFRRVDQRADLLMGQAALRRHELQAVAVRGVMAGGDHDGAVRAEAGGDDGHEHGRRGAHPVILDRGAGPGDALRRGAQQGRAGNAAVTAEADADPVDGLVQLFRQETGEGHAETGGHPGGQRRVIAQRAAAHVRTADQFFQIGAHRKSSNILLF